MALTEKQKQEVLEVLEASAYAGTYHKTTTKLWFEPNSDVLQFEKKAILSFYESCTVPYITDMSNVSMSISESVSVEFPNVVSIDTLYLDPDSSISAPELTTINNAIGMDSIQYISLPNLTYISDLKIMTCTTSNFNIPKLTTVDLLSIFGDFSGELNINTCGNLYVGEDTQFATKAIKYITDSLTLEDNGSIIFLDPPISINKIETEGQATIVAPESSYELFEGLQEDIELIFIPEED